MARQSCCGLLGVCLVPVITWVWASKASCTHVLLVVWHWNACKTRHMTLTCGLWAMSCDQLFENSRHRHIDHLFADSLCKSVPLGPLSPPRQTFSKSEMLPTTGPKVIYAHCALKTTVKALKSWVWKTRRESDKPESTFISEMRERRRWNETKALETRAKLKTFIVQRSLNVSTVI